MVKLMKMQPTATTLLVMLVTLSCSCTTPSLGMKVMLTDQFEPVPACDSTCKATECCVKKNITDKAGNCFGGLYCGNKFIDPDTCPPGTGCDCSSCCASKAKVPLSMAEGECFDDGDDNNVCGCKKRMKMTLKPMTTPRSMTTPTVTTRAPKKSG